MPETKRPWKCGRCAGIGKIKVWVHTFPEPDRFEWQTCPRCLNTRTFLKVVPEEDRSNG